MYGQKNYLAIIGTNSIYRIDQIGCFLTAFCNLMKGWGEDVDPVTLNNFFIAHGNYLYVGDKKADGSNILDGLAWGSVSAFDGNIHSTQVNTNAQGSWPQSNNAIVKFAFRGTTHFCKVADYTRQLIVDSYDGVTKATGYYGEPVAWAIYDKAGAVPIPVMTPVAAATSKSHVGEDLVLPASISSWRVYNIGGPWTSSPDRSIAKLNPQQFGGLRYQVLDNVASNIYVIQTSMFGKVAIYAGPDTPASFQAHEEPAAPAPAPAAPAPAPPEPAPAPAPAAEPVAQVSTPLIPTPAVAAPDPNEWKKSVVKNVADYTATQDYVVTYVDTGIEYADLMQGQVVHAVERFEKPDEKGQLITYVRTQKAVDKNVWPGVPLGALKLKKAIDIVEPDDDTVFKQLDLTGFADKLDARIKQVNTPGFRAGVVKLVGQIMLFFTKKKK